MRILLIEDELRLATIIGQALRESGFVVDHVADGRSGYLLAERSVFDVIVLDLMLPEKSGEQILRDLRKRKLHTPVLVLTAKESTDSVIALLNLGADDYLSKPFDLTELIARIRALLRRSKGTSSSTISFADLEIDTLQQTVTRGGLLIDLSSKEYQILEYLAHRPSAIVSKQELLEHVYDMDWERHSNVIEVHISNLRKKLFQGGAEPLIETLRHRGYRVQKKAG